MYSVSQAIIDAVREWNNLDKEICFTDIARMDIAIRRRFAFLEVWPDLTAVMAESVAVAVQLFADTIHTFAEFADEETLRLIPGHAYFLDPRPDLDLADRPVLVAGGPRPAPLGGLATSPQAGFRRADRSAG